MGWFGKSHKYGKKGELLGEGVSGCVNLYKAKDGQQTYAVKNYKSNGKHETREEYLERCCHEFHLLSKLCHPRIVKVVELLGVSGSSKVKMVMEYYPYSVRDVVVGQRRSMTRFKLYEQLIEGVQFLHAHQICHRDLKMDNLLLDETKNLKIIDFSDAVVGKDQCIGIVGTRSYVAPEVYKSFKYNPYRSDMWSMGVILYYFRYVSLPWKLANIDEDEQFKRFVENRDEWVDVEDESGSGILEIVLKLLDVDPESRLQVDELRKEFASLELDSDLHEAGN